MKSREPGSVVVSARGMVKRFANTNALRSVSLDLRPGEVHVLLGENGAGKSTLAKVISGIVVPDAGDLEIDGRRVSFRSPGDARRAGIEIVHQETTVIPKMTIEENITLGNEKPFIRAGVLRRSRLRSAVHRILEQVAPHLRADTHAMHLTWADKQFVAVAKALFSEPSVLILDEPTAALDQVERKVLFDVVRRARMDGSSILYVTHHLDEVAAIGDRVTVMRDGAVVAECAPSESESQLVAHIAGREISLKRTDPVAKARGKVVLEVRDLSAPPVLDAVSFSLHAHEVLCIYGVGQSGADELAEVLCGNLRPSAGGMFVNGAELNRLTVNKALRGGMSFLPGERARKGIVPTLAVEDNVNLSSWGRLGRFGFVRSRHSKENARTLAGRVRVREAVLPAPITSLSGGNQQKALLGRALGCRAPVLLLQDPTAGVDVGSRAEIYRSLRQVAQEESAVIVVTSSLSELLALADRAIVLHRGRVTADLSGGSLTKNRILDAALSATSSRDQAAEG